MNASIKTMWAAILVTMSLLLGACNPASQPENTPEATPGEIEPAKEIVLYNWTDYINPDLLTKFEEETGIKVTEDYFSSNEEMIAKLQGGVTGYSLLVPSDYAVAVLIEQGLLARLDQNNVPNLANLNERFKNPEVDPGNQYCVPYQWGTTGLGYRKDLVDAPQSWAAIFEATPDSAQYGRMTMLDDVRDGFAAALLYLGYDVNTTDEGQLQEARDLLIQVKGGLSGYDSDTYDDLLVSGENLVGHAWNGDIMMARDENEEVEYFIPEEGGIIYMEEVCIPASASAEEKLAAELFMNFLLDGENGALNSEYIYYGTPNEAAKQFLSEDYTSNPIINPSQEVLDRLHFLKPLGEFDLVYQRLWDEVRSAPTP